MAQTTVTNNFTKGLITEATGLNFPENACTAASNCVFTLSGDVTRRQGINLEPNYLPANVIIGNNACATYKWNNAGGDGLTQIIVTQVGSILYFYKSSAITSYSPLSVQILNNTVYAPQFVSNVNTFDPTVECQFTDGNGYLFVYHPDCDPFYCVYNNGIITANVIHIQIRDFVGVLDNLTVNTRPSSLSNEHTYNLVNQGWTAGSPWQGISYTTQTINTGSFSFQVQSGLTVSTGAQVNVQNLKGFYVVVGDNSTFLNANSVIMSGTVTSYTGTTMVLNINYVGSSQLGSLAETVLSDWAINPISTGFISTWFTDIGNYPSNSDVWWYYKDNTGSYNPSTTEGNVTLNTGQATQGHFILNAFDQNRSLLSGIPYLTSVTTSVRPRTGTWFQGRVWYTGVDAQQPATGDVNYYTWTENIYFSQVVLTPSDFGLCYQNNDPTSENLFDLLPTDGGVITIQGAGSIYKLFPIANGMLVFAANGVWFITGSQGIGFSASDYTITKISAVRSISPYSFVDVNGLPYFWNEEGIYMVSPQQGGQLSVEPITVGTILSYYNDIPYVSKKYARGAYDPINYLIQWTYSSTGGSYVYDTILNYNTYNKAFYPYNISTGNSLPEINSIVYVSSPGGNDASPQLTYLVSYQGTIQFGYEYDTSYLDWNSVVGTNYISTFTTGYRVHGNALYKFQMPYVYMFLRNQFTNFYLIQGIWDYATNSSSGRISSQQAVNVFNPNYGVVYKRHRIRGRGLSLQIQITSQTGKPFDIIGWSVLENVNQGV